MVKRDITHPLVLDVAEIAFVGVEPTGSERGDVEAIHRLHTVALEATISPAQALRLMTFAVIDLAELCENATDVMTAVIAMLREWRDGGQIDETIAQGFIELNALPVPEFSADEVIAAAGDEPTLRDQGKS